MSRICGIFCPGDPAKATPLLLKEMLKTMDHDASGNVKIHHDMQAGVAIGGLNLSPEDRFSEDGWFEDAAITVAVDGLIFDDPQDKSIRQMPPNIGAAQRIARNLQENRNYFPRQFDGFFALTAWDQSRKELWLARDTLGIKPLYYFEENGFIVFASELKGLLAHPDINRRISPEGLAAYLSYGYIPAPFSIFDRIYKVFPGERLRFDADGRLKKTVFRGIPAYSAEDGTLQEYAGQLRDLMIDSVERHINGRQRLAVFFSGGLESTVLLGILKLLGVPEIETFTMGFDVGASKNHLSEDLHFSAKLARKYGTIHHEIIVSKRNDAAIHLPEVIAHLDEPMLTPNYYSKYLLAREVQKHDLDFCLSGSNGEYMFDRLSEKKIQKMYHKAGEGAPLEKILFTPRMKFLSFEDQEGLLGIPREALAAVATSIHRRYFQDIQANDFGDQYFGISMRLQGAHKSINVQNQVSALSNVELRHPFFDLRILEDTNLIPAALKFHRSDTDSRILLKTAFRDILTDDILNRQKFGYPSYYWQQGETGALNQDLFSEANLAQTGFLSPEYVERILEKDRNSTSKKSAGKKTWGLLMLLAWHRTYMEQGVVYG